MLHSTAISRIKIQFSPLCFYISLYPDFHVDRRIAARFARVSLAMRDSQPDGA